MSAAKGDHYYTQLTGALTAGQWNAPNPAKAPNGSPLSWSELVRKFNKHCQGFQTFAQIAENTRLLALLMPSSTETFTGYVLPLGEEYTALPERRKELAEVQSAVKTLEDASDSSNCLLAVYAYALGDPTQCLAHLDKIHDLSDVKLPVFDEKSNATQRACWALSVAWSIRSLCLRGMSREILSPENLAEAVQSYTAALPLLTIVNTDLCPMMTPTNSGKVDYTSFLQYQELWSWVERLIWRGVVLASQYYDLQAGREQLWTWLNHYSSLSAFWPPNFCAGHRATVSILFLRTFVLSKSIPKCTVSQSELRTIRGLITSYRTLLAACTSFPRAGERNTSVEDFVEACVAVWEASGSLADGAGWVLDILWWATRLTFNSHIVFRYMVRVLYVSGDLNLAKRTLKLYVQIVDKAWQTASASGDSVVEDISAATDSDEYYIPTVIFGSYILLKSAMSSSEVTSIQDVREAGRLLERAESRIKSLGDVKEMRASLALAQGVYNVVLALKEQDPHERPNRLSAAHSFLLSSLENSPSAQAHFHLSLSFARASSVYNLDEAIRNASMAVELEPKEVRHWHLLGLLLSAKEEWGPAEVALDAGVALDDSLETSESNPEDGMPSSIRNTLNGDTEPQVDGLPPSPLSSASSSTEPVYVLCNGSREIPSSSSLLRPPLSLYPASSHHELFEHALQLRMSQVKVAEYVQGAEGASEMLREVFEWVAQKRGLTSSSTRSSTDHSQSRLADASRLKSPSEAMLDSMPEDGKQARHATRLSLSLTRTLSWSNKESAPAPPILIEPATPIESRSVSFDSEKETVKGPKLLKAQAHEREASKSKRVQRMLKDRVQQSGARMSAISKKLGSGVKVNGIRRSNSTPDFHAVLRQTQNQASSIHWHSRSRRRLSFVRPDSSSAGNDTASDDPPPPPPTLPQSTPTKWNKSARIARENRLLSNLWLMSAATFRRLGKIEQAKAAIQEAEVRDEKNPKVWVQLGLYYLALGNGQHQSAIDAFQKALFIDSDHVEATVHLCRLYVTSEEQPDLKDIDLAAGMLSYLTRGTGWDVPEAWYFLAKAYGLQGRKERERACLNFALELSEKRGIRDLVDAVGVCL